MEFLQVLRRFFSYRGYPKVMASDKGSQMVGAERKLRLMIEGLDKAKLKEFCADRGMKWQFTTPLAHTTMDVLNRWSRRRSHT